MPDSVRTIVITGVSRGLGRALAVELTRQGHRVAGCARMSPGLETVRQQLAPASVEAVDVADDRAVAAWAGRLGSKGLVPDLLINNAAVIHENRRLWEITAAEFDRVMAVNVNGTANVIRHFLPLMIPRGRGVIVNLSSGWGRSVSAEVAPYCASKWAIEGLTQALAEELPSGLSAVPVNPGIINTDMLRSCFASGAELYPAPDDWVKHAAPFLLQLGPDDNGRPLTVPER